LFHLPVFRRLVLNFTPPLDPQEKQEVSTYIAHPEIIRERNKGLGENQILYAMLRYVTLQTATCKVTYDKFFYGIFIGKFSVSSQDSLNNRSAINVSFVFS